MSTSLRRCARRFRDLTATHFEACVTERPDHVRRGCVAANVPQRTQTPEVLDRGDEPTSGRRLERPVRLESRADAVPLAETLGAQGEVARQPVHAMSAIARSMRRKYHRPLTINTPLTTADSTIVLTGMAPTEQRGAEPGNDTHEWIECIERPGTLGHLADHVDDRSHEQQRLEERRDVADVSVLHTEGGQPQRHTCRASDGAARSAREAAGRRSRDRRRTH